MEKALVTGGKGFIGSHLADYLRGKATEMRESKMKEWSIVMPIRDETSLLNVSLTSCYKLEPNEIVLCFDKPPHEAAFQKAKEISSHFDIPTKFLTVERNPEYKFHQAWVRRTGFRKAEHDRILTVDVDLKLTAHAARPPQLVGKDNIGLCSCSQLYYPNNAFYLWFWRNLGYHIARHIHPASFTGLYAIFRPFWLDSEDQGIKNLHHPKYNTGSMATIAEDTYLWNCMRRKHRVLHLKHIGAYCLTKFIEDNPKVQFETGRWLAERKIRWTRALRFAVMYARPIVFQGYCYQRLHKERIPTLDPHRDWLSDAPEFQG